jgi:hypothetical protein
MTTVPGTEVKDQMLEQMTLLALHPYREIARVLRVLCQEMGQGPYMHFFIVSSSLLWLFKICVEMDVG